MSTSPKGPKPRTRGPGGLWRGLALVLPVALHVATARAEVVARQAPESDDDFMARVLGPSFELAQKVVRSTEIAGGKLTLIGFVNIEDDKGENDLLVGHLLIETSPGRYEHVQFPSCDEEGGPPELLAVFFARTVKHGSRDLAVLCSWEVRHLDVTGMSYSALFYRVKETRGKVTVEPVTDLNGKVETDDLVEKNERGKWIEGPKPRFKSVAGVKRLMTKMGLKQ